LNTLKLCNAEAKLLVIIQDMFTQPTMMLSSLTSKTEQMES